MKNTKHCFSLSNLNNISAFFLITKTSLIIHYILFVERIILILKEHETQFCSKFKNQIWTKAIALAGKKYLKSTVLFNAFVGNQRSSLDLFYVVIVDFNDMSHSIGVIMI